MKWGYIVFGVEQHKAHALINKAGDVFTPRIGDADDMQKAIDKHREIEDDGCTPYITALEATKRAIKIDMEDNPDEESVYNVFFLSDGMPNDFGSTTRTCGNDGPVTNDPNDPYLEKVSDVVNLAPNRIFLSTAYYTPPENDPARRAADGLSYMAQRGHGKFVDLQNNDKLNFEEISLGEIPTAWIKKRMVVYNLNSAFCSNGKVGVDSDADGMCDEDEIKYSEVFSHRLDPGTSFDPQNRNSLNSKFSDLFAFKLKILPTGEGLKQCNLDEPDMDFDFLNSCEERALEDTQANGPTPQWTDKLMSAGGGTANKKNPDSDGDGFLDSLEFFQFGTKSSAVNYTNSIDRYSGGATGATLMLEHRNPMSADKPSASDYDLRVNSTGYGPNGENCFSFELNRMPLYETLAVTKEQVSGDERLVHEAGENIVMIYYIATEEENPNGQGYLFHSLQKFQAGPRFDIRLDQFQSYKVPPLDP